MFKETVHMSGELNACRAHHNGILTTTKSHFHCCYWFQRKMNERASKYGVSKNIIIIMMSSIVQPSSELPTRDRQSTNEWMNTERTCSRELSHNKIQKMGEVSNDRKKINIHVHMLSVQCWLHLFLFAHLKFMIKEL